MNISHDFPITKNNIYMNNGSIAPVSTFAIRSVISFLSRYSRLGPDSNQISLEMEKLMYETRMGIKRLINCDTNEIVFTQSTTQGLNIVANGLDWKKDQIIILRGGKHEHYANYFPWLYIARRKKLRIKEMSIDQNGYFEIGELEKLVKLKRTKLIVLSHALYNNGSIMPVEEVGKIARENNVLYCIDAAQTVGAINVDVKKIDCDFMAFPSFKWICGPLGIGIFYCNKRYTNFLIPDSIGGESGSILTNGILSHKEAPEKFQTGFRNYPGLSGLESAIRYILRIGITKIRSRNIKISSILRDELIKISNVEVYGPEDSKLRTSIVPFASSKIDSKSLKAKLENEGIIMAERDLGDKKIVRASPHFFNSEDEAIKVASIIRKRLSYQ